MSTKPVKKTSKKRRVGDGTPGPGRPKGVGNRITSLVREGLARAYDEVGGHEWLVKLAADEPRAFASLLAKCLPSQVTGADDGPIQFERVAKSKKAQAAAMQSVEAFLEHRTH